MNVSSYSLRGSTVELLSSVATFRPVCIPAYSTGHDYTMATISGAERAFLGTIEISTLDTVETAFPAFEVDEIRLLGHHAFHSRRKSATAKKSVHFMGRPTSAFQRSASSDS